MIASKQYDLVAQELHWLRGTEIRRARRNPYSAALARNYLVAVYETRELIRTICGSDELAMNAVTDWFHSNPFRFVEGVGFRKPSRRRSTLVASIIAATSRAPGTLQNRWSIAVRHIDDERGDNLSLDTFSELIASKGGIRGWAEKTRDRAVSKPTKRQIASDLVEDDGEWD